jgi:hypothetical protein
MPGEIAVPTADRNALLNRLLQIHTTSLPMYLASAKPWVPRGHEKDAQTLALIIADQQRMAQRLTDEILDSEGTIEPGEFPMTYTDLHDLSVDYLLKALAKSQQSDLAEIEDCARQLGGDPVAQEAVGAAKAHLESLEELLAEPVHTPAAIG